MTSIINKTLSLLVLMVIAAYLHANDSENQELTKLLALLDEQTKLATQSKMNADYVPGMVTVLHGEDLESYGVATISDALDKVAGFHTTVNNFGGTATIVRGVGGSLNSTNLKIMLNGVPVNNAIDGSADWAFRLPIELVDRIEVIRGPGSALYGEHAFSGVINIIPRTANKFGIKFGSDQRRQGDALVNEVFDSGAQLALSLSHWDRNNSGRSTGEDVFAARGLGNSPGLVNDHERGRTVIANVQHQGYSLQAQLTEVVRGGWYGRGSVLPRGLDPRDEKVANVHLAKFWNLSADLRLDVGMGILKTDTQLAAFLPIPAGIDPPGPPGASPFDLFRKDRIKNTTKRANLGLHWSPSDTHALFFEANYSHSRNDSSLITEFELEPTYSSTTSDRSIGPERTLTSFTVQDQWRASDKLELTIGGRYDHYSDWENHISPRFAAVWREGDHHIFKLQYSDSFRPPSLGDLNPGPNVRPAKLNEERLSSTEFSYIFRGPGYSFRSTLFETKVKDLLEFFIDPGSPPVIRNNGDLNSVGIELEWQQKIGREWEWFANVSYVHAEDKLDSDHKRTGAIDWLANLGTVWHATDDSSHALHLRYVGEQEGWEIERPAPNAPQTRKYDDYSLLNYTYSLKNVFDTPQLSFYLTINNMANHSYNVLPNPAKYPSGLPNGERTAWFKLSYDY